MKNLIPYILCTFVSATSSACDIPNWSLNQWLQNADAVYYGRVISISVAKESSNFEEVFEEPSSAVIDRDIQFRVISQIKSGKTQTAEINATLSWCGGGEVEFLGKAIFVVQNGYWTSFSRKEDIEWFLSNQSSKK